MCDLWGGGSGTKCRVLGTGWHSNVVETLRHHEGLCSVLEVLDCSIETDSMTASVLSSKQHAGLRSWICIMACVRLLHAAQLSRSSKGKCQQPAHLALCSPSILLEIWPRFA